MAKGRLLGEYDERLAAMMASMDAHIRADSLAFETLAKQIIEVNQDVKSIIAARNFAAGVWKTISIVSTVIITLATIYVAYLRH